MCRQRATCVTGDAISSLDNLEGRNNATRNAYETETENGGDFFLRRKRQLAFSPARSPSDKGIFSANRIPKLARVRARSPRCVSCYSGIGSIETVYISFFYSFFLLFFFFSWFFSSCFTSLAISVCLVVTRYLAALYGIRLRNIAAGATGNRRQRRCTRGHESPSVNVI